jgi:hypothetical protein
MKSKGRKMDYRKYAKDLLSRKHELEAAYITINRELEFLEKEKYSCKVSVCNLPAHSPAEKAYRERLIGIISDMEDCRMRGSVVERELTKIEKGMEGLDEYYRDILNGFFIAKHTGVSDDLMERWSKERSTLYRDRTRALEQFTRSVYGVVEL